MQDLIKTFGISEGTRQILHQMCEKHAIGHIKEFVDVYRHKPDIFFEAKGFSSKCWDEISQALSDPGNPYIPGETVISYDKAKLIVKRNRLIDDLTELTRSIQEMR